MLLDLFFSWRKDDQVLAKAICAKCSHRAACLEEALRIPQAYNVGGGIWGGTDPQERRSIRARRRAAGEPAA